MTDNIEQAIGEYIIYATDPAKENLKNALVPNAISEEDFFVLFPLIENYSDRHKDKGDANIIRNITDCIHYYINEVNKNSDILMEYFKLFVSL